MMSKEAMKLALEALEHMLEDAKQERLTVEYWNECVDAITAIKQARSDHTEDNLEMVVAPVQEPRCAVIVEVFGKDWRLDYMSLPVGKHKLYTQQYIYTTPPAAQRQWVGLTDEEIKPLCDENRIIYGAYTVDFIQAIEAKLKEKNT